MKNKLASMIKHPLIKMKVQEKELKRKMMNEIAKEQIRMKNHSRPIHKKMKRL